MNTERTEKFVNAIACDLEEGGFRQVSGTTLRRALATAVSAALPLLADTGFPTPQPAELAEQQVDALRSFACEAVEYFRERSDVVDGEYGSPSPNEEMKLLSEGEAALAASQPGVNIEQLDRALGETIDQRDRYHEVADDLAGHIERITGVEIGEHSSDNCPWQNAIEAAESYSPAQGIDLGQLPDGWSLRTLATCYQLSDGNQVVGNLVGPDAKKNAVLIAALIDQRDAAPGVE